MTTINLSKFKKSELVALVEWAYRDIQDLIQKDKEESSLIGKLIDNLQDRLVRLEEENQRLKEGSSDSSSGMSLDEKEEWVRQFLPNSSIKEETLLNMELREVPDGHAFRFEREYYNSHPHLKKAISVIIQRAKKGGYSTLWRNGEWHVTQK